MNYNLILIFSILFSVGILIPAYAQTSENIVINEVDINPSGDDSASISEWIELYNPADSDVDIGEWKIASTTALKKTLIIPSGTVIEPEEFLVFSYQNLWFTDTNESVELLDSNGIVIDKTPVFSDPENSFISWQRLYDGYDSDSDSDWKFVQSSTGSTNGKLIQSKNSDEVGVSVSTTKSSYVFGDSAIIKGSISKEIATVQSYFLPVQILVNISGPNFDTVVPLYPDLNLNYKTTLSLHQILGIHEGNYDVAVTYGNATANTSFSVGYETIKQETTQDAELSIVTDKSQYIPGQLVSITGFTSDVIPYEGMKFTLTDSSGKLTANGNLFPTDGKFLTSVFLNNIDPVLGTYNIIAEYSEKSASTSFEVVEDVKEDVLISLWTDKAAYGTGDKVQITGRLNHAWVSALDLKIVQTKQSTAGSSLNGSDTGFKILDGVQVLGDGFFTYSFTIPDHMNRLGDYRISVSKDIGAADIIVYVVENPDEFVVSDIPLTVTSDKAIYDINDKIVLSGFVKDSFGDSSSQNNPVVNISISNEDGAPLEITALASRDDSDDGKSVDYDFTAVPETSGRYSVQIDLSPSIFSVGTYVVKSQYLDDVARSTFMIIDPLDLTDGAIITTDKEVYGLGETVFLTGVVPPTSIQGIDIFVTKPDGTVTKSGTSFDNQRFSWSWDTPKSESSQHTDSAKRSALKSNFGIYKITVYMDSFRENIFFKVSEDPENDFLSDVPLFISTEKSLYKAGEKLKVIGNVIQHDQGDEGLRVPPRVTIQISDDTLPFKHIHESSVYPTQGGGFTGLFELPATIFSEGSYTVKASYLGASDDVSFSIVNDFAFGGDDDLALLLSTDKSEYYPGDVVLITGKPNKLIYLNGFDVSVTQKSDDEITCGSFVCGVHDSPSTFIRPSSSGSFTHQFAIPDTSSAVGTYKITVDADFEKKSIEFNVVEKPQPLKPGTIVEKVNRISESAILVATGEKIIDDMPVIPRVLSGSLLTPDRGDESDVNLKVLSDSGICIIGPDDDCLVKESTRKRGQIYDVVNVDGINFNVRYSGPDVRLEKFSILPESLESFLPDVYWVVKVLKDDQVSQFYYKITYKISE